MPSYELRTEADRQKLVNLIGGIDLAKPWMLSIDRPKKKRTLKQNRLQREWLNEISRQLGDRTPEEVRGECKLTIGVPILRAENPDFRAHYDRVVRPLPYETKLALMMEPFDFPVTRLMTTAQHAKYLDEVQRHFAEQGVVLTEPVG